MKWVSGVDEVSNKLRRRRARERVKLCQRRDNAVVPSGVQTNAQSLIFLTLSLPT